MIKSGTTFYDEKNGRYLTPTGVGVNPKVWLCEVQEIEDDELVTVDMQLFTEGELKKFKEV